MAKFKVGDIVAHKEQVRRAKMELGSVITLMVIEVLEQTCYAGTQVHYDCRDVGSSCFGREYVRFVEIELVPQEEADAAIVEIMVAKHADGFSRFEKRAEELKALRERAKRESEGKQT